MYCLRGLENAGDEQGYLLPEAEKIRMLSLKNVGDVGNSPFSHIFHILKRGKNVPFHTKYPGTVLHSVLLLYQKLSHDSPIWSL